MDNPNGESESLVVLLFILWGRKRGRGEKLCVEQNNKKSRKTTMKKRRAKRVDEKK